MENIWPFHFEKLLLIMSEELSFALSIHLPVEACCSNAKHQDHNIHITTVIHSLLLQ